MNANQTVQFERHIYTKPLGIINNCILRINYETLEAIIEVALVAMKLPYRYSKAVSRYLINTKKPEQNEDEEYYHADIYISRTQEGYYCVEIYRYGGNGFITQEVMYNIINNYMRVVTKAQCTRVIDDNAYWDYLNNLRDMYYPNIITSTV